MNLKKIAISTFISNLLSTVKPTVASPTTACVSGWSNWINENGDADGDHEQMTEEELRNLCPGGIVTDIDCVTGR